MKYETPQMTALTPAINAIQSSGSSSSKVIQSQFDGSEDYESPGAYTDWES